MSLQEPTIALFIGGKWNGKTEVLLNNNDNVAVYTRRNFLLIKLMGITFSIYSPQEMSDERSYFELLKYMEKHPVI